MIAISPLLPSAGPDSPEEACQYWNYVLSAVERSIDVLERLGGLDDNERTTLRQMALPPYVLVGSPSSAPSVSTLDLRDLMAELGDVVISDEPTQDQSADLATTDEPGPQIDWDLISTLPNYPRVTMVWERLFGETPTRGEAVACGYHLSRAYYDEFGKRPRCRVIAHDGYLPSNQKLYPKEWLAKQVYTFVMARRGGACK